MNDSTIEQVLKSVNIVDVISSYIPLKRAGSNYKARCPFHDEKTASFNVSEPKQMFKCFGCGKGGNAITFVRDYEKISFGEALRKLAERAGIQIKTDEYASKKNSRRDLIYTIYELANDFYVQNFKKYGNAVKGFLTKRQIPVELAEELSLGYALDSFSGLKSYLVRNQINTTILPETGLFKTNEKNDTYDIFRDRLMFPIHSVSGKVVAFGGRSLNEQEKAYKYINSPTTDIYLKGRELYGLHLTRFEISKKDSALICEGYMDFLRLYQKGFKNAVASLGTALTPEQINLLSRYTKNFFLLYDGDDAGIKAAVKAALLVIQHGCQAKIILLPEKHDPDSFLLNHSPEELQEHIDTAQVLVKFVQTHTSLFSGERQAIQMLLDISLQIEDTIIRELYIKEIAETFQISELNLRKSIRPQRTDSRGQTLEDRPQTSDSRPQTSDSRPQSADIRNFSYKFEEERKLLKLLLKNPDQIKKVAEKLDSSFFLNENLQKIYNYLINLEDIDTLNTPAILLEKISNTIPHIEADDQYIAPLTRADDQYIAPPVQGGGGRGGASTIIDDLTHLFFDADFMDSIDDLIRQVKLRKLEYDLKILNEKIARDLENAELLEQKYFLKKEIVKLSKNIVRKTITV